MPLLFLANHGQAPPAVGFMARGPGLTAYFSSGEVLFRVAGNNLRMHFEGAAHASRPEALSRLAGVANFLTGPKDRWLLAQPLYGGVVYRSLYPGIDMIYGATGGDLKSEFVVAPKADPSAIRVRYPGGGKPRIREDGSLAIPAGAAEFREQAPSVYQERDGRRVAVEGRFVLAGEAVSFSISEYDASRPLIIDPAISYSTLLGGSGADAANALAVDSTGAAYLAGFTESINFPTANPAQHFNAGSNDAFVAKLSSDGTALVYCTYLGGSGDDRAYGIAVDAAGAVYVTGSTTSQNFPVVRALQSKLAGVRNAFVVKLAAAGNSLIYSTYLGGSLSDSGNGIAVDAAGSAYVAGDATSQNFPASGLQKADRGGQDAFVAKLSADGSHLAYSTYLGGSSTDHGAAIAVDTTGAAWVAGSTWSADFPTTPSAFQSSSGGGQDAFVARLAADGNTLLFGSYLGGSGGSVEYPEAAQAIALDWQGNAYVAGVTNSTNFPLLNPLQSSLNGATDAFVTKVNASGTLAYSTYLGGSGVEVANAIAVDPSGAGYIAGYTYSTDLPVVNALQSSNAGDCDAFLARVSATGTLDYLTYLGGNGADTATAVALASGNVYVAGWTLSTNFPLRNAYQSADADNYGAFVTKLDSGSPPANTGVAPNSGGGASQTFGFQFSDDSGATDLTTVSVLFNSTPSAVNGCAVVYNRVANALSLLTNAGGPPAGPITPGSGTGENSQCILNGAGSSVSAAGNVLTLNLAITFQAPMAGAMNIYMQSANLSASTGWNLTGNWTVPAMIVSPANKSQLSGASVAFQWTGMGNFSACSLSVSGIGAGGTDIFNGALGTGTSQMVSNLPLDGRLIYVRIGSTTGSGWLYVDYLYAAAILLPGAMSSPANGSTLPGSTATFQWSGNGVSQYWLYVSKVAPGGGDLDSVNAGVQTSLTVTNLPLDGSAIYVRLSSLMSGSWRYADYTFAAAGLSPAAMTSPVNGTILSGSTVTFQWSAGVGISQYWIYIGSAAGGKDIYSGSQGTNTSKTFTNLPTDGSTIYVRLWSQIGSTWQFLDTSYVCSAALTQIAPPTDSASLASYLAAAPFYSFDFSSFPNWDYATPPTSNQLGDGVLTLAFSSTMLRFTVPDGGWQWGVAPNSQRADVNAVLPILDPYNPLYNPTLAWNAATNWFGLANLTITLSRPVWAFGFEASPDYRGTITATFYTASSGSLTIVMNGMAYPQSRIFAATGALITKVSIALTNAGNYPDFAIGAFRYALSAATAPNLAQTQIPAAAAMISPANGATLPGSTVTFQWSSGQGVSDYWLYLSKVAPGGKEIYSNTLGLKTSQTFTSLPTDGSTLYVRLWSQIGAAWQYADTSYKAATIR